MRASDAPLVTTNGRAVGPDGSVYLSGWFQVFAIRPDGVLRVVAGNGLSGFSGDGGPAVQARLSTTYGIAVDKNNNVYIGDGYRIRRVSPDGIITTVAGNGYPPGAATDGPALSSNINPARLAADSKGNVYFTEFASRIDYVSHRVRRLTPDGMVRLFAGADNYSVNDGDGGPATAAHVYANTIAVDSNDNLLIAGRGAIRKVTSSGTIAALLGSDDTSKPFAAEGARANDTYFQSISGIAVDGAGTVYLSATDFQQGTASWKIATDGILHKIETQSAVLFAVDGTGGVYYNLASGTLYRLPPSGAAVCLTGAGTSTSPDGSPAIDARLQLGSVSETVDAEDRLLFTEFNTCRIRAIATDGTLQTIAGTGKCATHPSAGPALTTDLCLPLGIAASSSGSVFIGCADGNFARLGSGGTISLLTVPVTVTSGGGCSQMAADGKDNLYCVKFGVLYRLAPDGTNSTLTNTQQPVRPSNVAVGPLGMVYVAAQTVGLTSLYVLTGDTLMDTKRPIAFVSSAMKMAIDRRGDAYVTDGGSLYRWTSTNISVVGIRTPQGFSGDNGPAQSAQYGGPTAPAADSKGNIYFVDTGSQRIRRITPAPLPPVPVISQNGVVNSASYAGASLSTGELVSIFGQNLAQATAAFTLRDLEVDSALVSTKVYVNGVEVPVISVSPGQVNAIIPQDLPGGPLKLHVEVDGVASQDVVLPVAGAAIGLFTANASGSGQGSIVNPDGSVNSQSNPALRGAFASLYGTGAGLVDPPLFDGYLSLSATLSKFQNSVSVRIGGTDVPVLYAGTAPSLVAGVAQLNVALPAGLPSGANDVVMTVAGQASNKVTIWLR